MAGGGDNFELMLELCRQLAQLESAADMSESDNRPLDIQPDVSVVAPSPVSLKSYAVNWSSTC
jgi:hypothetical protein